MDKCTIGEKNKMRKIPVNTCKEVEPKQQQRRWTDGCSAKGQCAATVLSCRNVAVTLDSNLKSIICIFFNLAHQVILQTATSQLLYVTHLCCENQCSKVCQIIVVCWNLLEEACKKSLLFAIIALIIMTLCT